MSSSDDQAEVTSGLTGLGHFLSMDGVKVHFQLLFFLYLLASSGFIVFRNVYL